MSKKEASAAALGKFFNHDGGGSKKTEKAKGDPLVQLSQTQTDGRKDGNYPHTERERENEREEQQQAKVGRAGTSTKGCSHTT